MVLLSAERPQQMPVKLSECLNYRKGYFKTISPALCGVSQGGFYIKCYLLVWELKGVSGKWGDAPCGFNSANGQPEPLMPTAPKPVHSELGGVPRYRYSDIHQLPEAN